MLPILRFLLILFLPFIVNGAGAVYYVATTGNNANNGSINSPWLTIRYGAMNMNGGDILYIRGGTYPDDGFDIQEWKSGSPNNQTRIEAYNGESVIYAPNAGAGENAHGFDINGKSNIVFSGITIDARNCVSDGIKIEQGSIDITLTNMTVFGCPTGMGILTTAVDEGDLMRSLITHCTVITNGWNPTTNSSPLHQIYLQTSGMTVENCIINGATNNGGGTVGIHYFGSHCTNGVIRNNLIYGGNVGILAGASYGSNFFIYNNIISSNSSWGISTFRMTHVYIFNNTCYTNNAQIISEESTNIWIENNIAVGGYANNPGGIYVYNSDSVTVKNNISYGCTLDGSRIYDYRNIGSVNTTTSNNLFSNPEGGPLVAEYNVKFYNITNWPFDFHLNPTSDAINAGRVQTLFDFDYDNKKRVNNWNTWHVGAYEFLYSETKSIGRLRFSK